MTDNSERSQGPLASNPRSLHFAEMLDRAETFSDRERGELADLLRAMTFEGGEAETCIERLTRERDDAARLYGTKEALDALRDRKTLESERAAWEKRAMEAEADWRRLRVALDNLVGAVGALSDPEDQLSCIPAGPEAEELWQAWKDGEAALSGEQPPSET